MALSLIGPMSVRLPRWAVSYLNRVVANRRRTEPNFTRADLMREIILNHIRLRRVRRHD